MQPPARGESSHSQGLTPRRCQPAPFVDRPHKPRSPSTDLDQLLAFYDFPGPALGASENYQSIESTFATVRNRSKITKGPGSRAAGIAMAYKLIEAAQSRRRAVNAPTWSPSPAPEPNSRTANPSNDATNQEVKIKPRNHADPQS